MRTDFTIELVKGSRPSLNGELTARVALSVGDESEVVRKINLDSEVSVDRMAKKWALDFSLDRSQVLDRLNEIGATVTAKAQEAQARAASAPKATRRVSTVADEFLRSLKPAWHRKAKSLYLDGLEREATLAELWTLASDCVVDNVSKTIESRELSPDPENPPPYKIRLGLLKDAIRMAAGRLLRELPELNDIERDKTVHRDQLLHFVVKMLLAARTFKGDADSIQTSYLAWGRGIAPGSTWQQCFIDPVFGRIVEADNEPIIAVSGDHFTSEIRHESKRRLAADLRALGLADTDSVLRCYGKLWRVWTLDRTIIESIGGPES